MDRYFCIHGHFYQPPRENPWLEAVEEQDSAFPYHDWNLRITEECYASNGASRILNDQKQILKIVNNYAKISFNFGPTLLSWMQTETPHVYQRIIDADHASLQNLENHGSAMAQAYNHMIMPLANATDKYTQVYWGIKDFEFRFKRKPEGMWLPETAVDLATLKIMADLGLTFTILAQHQAKQVRKLGEEQWHDVTGGKIDPTQAYLLKFPDNKTINIFFYDGPVSQAVAFEGLLKSGEFFANRILGIFGKRHQPQLANIATDGETYGHHHQHGDMALAYALDYVEKNNLAKVCNYSYFLAKCPPTMEVEIYENTAWSCAHGVERWRSNCGCNTGGNSSWNQNWRQPLRDALDWLRDQLFPFYEEKSKSLFKDAVAARNEYIDVILDRQSQNLENFFKNNAQRNLNAAEQEQALTLLEMQRHAMLMYTSCGWFFDELSGIETVQVISYAARAIQLATKLGHNVESEFLEKLALAKSNIRKLQDGRRIYEQLVKPAMLDWIRIGAHYAISSLFEQFEKNTQIYCYEVENQEFHENTSGNIKLICGYAKFRSEITHEQSELAFSALHMGDQNISCGVLEYEKLKNFPQIIKEISQTFERGDLVSVIGLISEHFDHKLYSIQSLFRDEQRRVLKRVIEPALSEVEITFKHMYQHYALLMRFIEELNTPLPESFKITAAYVINLLLREEFSKEQFTAKEITKLLKNAKKAKINLNKLMLSFTFQQTLERIMIDFSKQSHDISNLDNLISGMKIVKKLPFQINLFHIQNHYYELMKTVYPERQTHENDNNGNQQWVEKFRNLGELLAIAIS